MSDGPLPLSTWLIGLGTLAFFAGVGLFQGGLDMLGIAIATFAVLAVIAGFVLRT